MLTADEINLLYELYEVPQIDSIIVIGDMGVDQSPNYMNPSAQVAAQLSKAIELIQMDEAKSLRVSEILVEYKDLAIDRSNIDKDGYSFRARKNEKAMLRRLFTVIGIIKTEPTFNNQVLLG